MPNVYLKKSGVALTHSFTLYYSRKIFYYQHGIDIYSVFLCCVVDELPAFIIIAYNFSF